MFKKHLYNFAPTRTALFKLAFLGCLCFQEKSQNQKPTSQNLVQNLNYRNIFSLTFTLLLTPEEQQMQNTWNICVQWRQTQKNKCHKGHKWQHWTSSRVPVKLKTVSFPFHIPLSDTNPYQHRLSSEASWETIFS